ncbi:MAG: Uncharacterised protein [Flavobacteriia bacterium]|nr:MAG: Uncharacterised protein [Flavobacteriia bacterium]
MAIRDHFVFRGEFQGYRMGQFVPLIVLVGDPVPMIDPLPLRPDLWSALTYMPSLKVNSLPGRAFVVDLQKAGVARMQTLLWT